LLPSVARTVGRHVQQACSLIADKSDQSLTVREDRGQAESLQDPQEIVAEFFALSELAREAGFGTGL
jgi:hypothetical protein